MTDNIRTIVKTVEETLSAAEEQIHERTGLHISLYYEKQAFNPAIEDEVHRIVKLLCEEWGVNVDYIKQKCRERHITIMRSICYTAIRKSFPKYIYNKIGEIFNVDHTTVLHGMESFKQDLKAEDKMFMLYYNPVKHIVDEAEVEQ